MYSDYAIKRGALFALFGALLPSRSLAQTAKLHFSNVFGSNMVLQHSTPKVMVWGWGPANINTTITLSNSTYQQSWSQMSAASDGYWKQTFDPLPLGGGPYTIVASTATETTTLQNVLAGDVFWCGGQSNAQFSTVQAFNGTEEIAGAGSYPQIRVFSAGSSFKAKGPIKELGSVMIPWQVASPKSVGGANWTSMSAQCWMFGRKLADTLGSTHPIGLLSNNYGGSTIGAWLEESRFLACNKTGGGEPPNIHGNNPVVLFNTFFTPYTGQQGPFALKGWTWLQGEEEADLGFAPFYPCAFPSLVDQFRTYFGTGDDGYFGVIAVGAWVVHSPFQPGIGGGNEGPPSVRDTQLRTALTTPNMGWTTAADCGDISSPFTPIHFRDKETPTTRLAQQALAQLYGVATVANAPLYASAAVSGNAVTVSLTWDPRDAGPLQLRPNVVCPRGVPAEFCGNPGAATLLASDGKWYNATLSLTPDGKGVVLTAPATAPAGPISRTALGWFAWPLLTAYSEASGLPVMPWNCAVTGDCWAAAAPAAAPGIGALA